MSLEGTGLNERSHMQKMTTRPGATVADTMYTAGLCPTSFDITLVPTAVI